MDTIIPQLIEIMKEIREKRDLNQYRVAEALGIGRSTFSEMESSKSAFDFERWLNWCKVLKVSPSDVLRKLEESSVFVEINEERRQNYYKLIDLMIRYGHGIHLETIMFVFEEIIARETRIRRQEKSKRALKELHPRH